MCHTKTVVGNVGTKRLISTLLIRTLSSEVSFPSTPGVTTEVMDLVVSEIWVRNACTSSTKVSYISGDSPPDSSTSSGIQKEVTFLRSLITVVIYTFSTFNDCYLIGLVSLSWDSMISVTNFIVVSGQSSIGLKVSVLQITVIIVSYHWRNVFDRRDDSGVRVTGSWVDGTGVSVGTSTTVP